MYSVRTNITWSNLVYPAHDWLHGDCECNGVLATTGQKVWAVWPVQDGNLFTIHLKQISFPLSLHVPATTWSVLILNFILFYLFYKETGRSIYSTIQSCVTLCRIWESLSQRWLWIVLSSGIQRRVVRWKSTDGSEEHTASVFCFYADFLLGLVFDNEDEGDMFVRNVSWLSTDYMAFSC
jgi:hypothetical protein